MTGRFTGTALFVLLWGAPGAATDLPATLSIPETEFELGEETHKPIPMPDLTGNPVQQMMDTLSLDMTGTLPDAVLEELLGASPYDFTDVVWGMEVTGNWTQDHTGTGTLQVTNFTEGRGASPQIDPERFAGQQGFRMYNAQLATDGDHTFTLSAIFPPDPGGTAFGTELDGTKGVFEVTWLCHMFEPGLTGCIDHDDEYYHTPLPDLQSLHVQQRGDGYRMTFQARVIEHRRHRDHGYSISEPTGRVGDVRGWVCDRASWEVDPESCISGDPLTIEENTPGHGRENVNLVTPGIAFTFSEPVDIDSLTDSFSLSTRDWQGKRIHVSGEIDAESPTRFVFEPDDELESGVRYEARVKGGEDGVWTRGGGRYMGADHWWRFSTLVDLAYHDGPADDPLKVDVYQTIRNAPLVEGKPAVVRINAEWREHMHIHPDWQPTTYEAELELNVISPDAWRVDAQFGGPVEENVLRVIRPDQLADSEVRRHARHTINVYGWTPDGRFDSTRIEARLRPHDPYPVPLEPQDVIAERRVSNWHVDPDPLVLRYAYLAVGPWSDGVPEQDRQLGRSVMQMAEEFAQQIFPVREVRSVFTGVEAARPGGGATPMFSLLRDMRGDATLGAAPDDVFVVFYPLGVVNYGGGSRRHRFDTEADRGVIANITESVGAMPVLVSMMAEVLVHEIAHHHGLGHRGGDYPELKELDLLPGGFADPGIEGFRIALDGMSGWNKSYEEGNAQWLGVPTPLMWPSPLVIERVWINEDEYQSLMDTLSR